MSIKATKRFRRSNSAASSSHSVATVGVHRRQPDVGPALRRGVEAVSDAMRLSQS